MRQIGQVQLGRGFSIAGVMVKEAASTVRELRGSPNSRLRPRTMPDSGQGADMTGASGGGDYCGG